MIELIFLSFVGVCAYASYKFGFNDGVVTGVDGTIKHFAKNGLYLSDEMKKVLESGE